MQEGLSIILSHWEKYENLADIYCSFLVDWEILWPVRALFSSFWSIKEEYKYEYNLKNIQWASFFKNVYLWVWKVSAIHSLACLLSDATWCFSLSRLSFLDFAYWKFIMSSKTDEIFACRIVPVLWKDYKRLYVYFCF